MHGTLNRHYEPAHLEWGEGEIPMRADHFLGRRLCVVAVFAHDCAFESDDERFNSIQMADKRWGIQFGPVRPISSAHCGIWQITQVIMMLNY